MVLQACVIRGKDLVLDDLDRFEKITAAHEAHAWGGDYEERPWARTLQQYDIALLEMMIRLRGLSMETIRATLAKHNALPSDTEIKAHAKFRAAALAKKKGSTR